MVSFKLNRPAAAAKPPGSRSPRRRVLIEGQFQLLTATYQVAVRNLSCTGALIESKVPLPVGGTGVLATSHVDCFCRVIWSRDTLYGLSFDEPLNQAVVVNIHRITQRDVERDKIADAKQWWGAAG